MTKWIYLCIFIPNLKTIFYNILDWLTLLAVHVSASFKGQKEMWVQDPYFLLWISIKKVEDCFLIPRLRNGGTSDQGFLLSFWIVSQDGSHGWTRWGGLLLGHLSLWRVLSRPEGQSNVISWTGMCSTPKCAVLLALFLSWCPGIKPTGWTWGLSVSSSLHVTGRIKVMDYLEYRVMELNDACALKYMWDFSPQNRKCDIFWKKYSQILSILRWNYPRL